jgi:hypothetical protein
MSPTPSLSEHCVLDELGFRMLGIAEGSGKAQSSIQTVNRAASGYSGLARSSGGALDRELKDAQEAVSTVLADCVHLVNSLTSMTDARTDNLARKDPKEYIEVSVPSRSSLAPVFEKFKASCHCQTCTNGRGISVMLSLIRENLDEGYRAESNRSAAESFYTQWAHVVKGLDKLSLRVEVFTDGKWDKGESDRLSRSLAQKIKDDISCSEEDGENYLLFTPGTKVEDGKSMPFPRRLLTYIINTGEPGTATSSAVSTVAIRST